VRSERLAVRSEADAQPEPGLSEVENGLDGSVIALVKFWL
jgi:hypothetical protein